MDVCMDVCMYVMYIYIWMYICMYVMLCYVLLCYVYVCMYVCYVCVYVCLYVCMYVCNVCMYVCMYVCIPLYSHDVTKSRKSVKPYILYIYIYIPLYTSHDCTLPWYLSWVNREATIVSHDRGTTTLAPRTAMRLAYLAPGQGLGFPWPL